METVMVLFYVIATMVTSSRHSSAFSIDREDMTSHNLQSTTNSYPDWSVGLSSEDDVNKRSVAEFTCQEPSEADLINQLHSKVLAGDHLRTNSIPEDQMVPKWEEITGMGIYVQNGHHQPQAPSALLRRNLNRRSLCPWTKTPHNDSSRVSSNNIPCKMSLYRLH
ncbi:hypothetical protein HOLleu_02251 [Holothuria leucospilota]|uniref:Uncharacterized protein n=1 Tax=Holothuria leucospilota TaxID=206669 RepID=A0A9Q1HJN0_HOLLE|nr:hypothetical protein HOLleu_02251 [Holothuria leucospilota]